LGNSFAPRGNRRLQAFSSLRLEVAPHQEHHEGEADCEEEVAVHVVSPLRNGVVATGVEGMATPDAAHAQTHASNYAVALDGFGCVMRATRLEATRRP
jgi:hypothetical protein